MAAAAMSLEDRQMQRFRERLTRIEKKGGKVEIAPVGVVEYDDKGKARMEQTAQVVGPDRAYRFMRALILSPFVLATALVIGAAAVVAVRAGRVAYDGGALTGDGAGMAMLTDAGIAFVVLMVVKLLFRMRGRLMLVGQLAGLAAGVLAMHDLVHVAPDLWRSAFPEAWVSDVLATTTPNSILIRGVSYVM